MSKIGASKVRNDPGKHAVPEAEHVTVIVLRKRGGGYAASIGRAPAAAIEETMAHAPDGLDMALSWATSRIEELVQRGRLK